MITFKNKSKTKISSNLSLWRCVTLLTLTISGCITQIDQALKDFERQLVVEGGISNLPGPYTVALNYTGDILAQQNRARIPVTGAIVSVEQENGPLFALTEISPGIYKSDSSKLQGEIGKSYRLVFTIEEGKTFQSNFSTIPESPTITNSNVEFQSFTVSSETNTLLRRNVQQHVVSITLENLSSNSYYKFEGEGIIQRLIQPNPPLFPPDSCEEFFFGPSVNGPTLNCWQAIGAIPNGIKILSNELFESPEITTEVLTIPFSDRGDYLATVNVKAINATEYDFWSVVNEQNQVRSDLFNPPLEAIVGNIQGITDQNEVVAGYFSTHSITKQNVCISRINEESIKPFPVTLAPCFANCLTLFPNATWDAPDEFGNCY